MPRFGLCGPFYTPQSISADSQLTINLYPEIVASGSGKSNLTLYGTPGLRVFARLPERPVRAMITIPRSYPTRDRMFAIGGSQFCEITWDGVAIEATVAIRGVVANDGFPAYMAFNGQEIAIASGQGLYMFNIDTNAFTGPIMDTDGGFVLAIAVVFLKSFFIVNRPGTQFLQFSAPNDGQTWDAADIFSAESNPDRALMIMTANDDLWVFGDSTTQVFDVDPSADELFVPIPGGVIEQGISAPASVARLDNSNFWVGKDPERGGITVWRSRGYAVQKASNYAVDTQLNRMPDAFRVLGRGYAFFDQGHPVYQINFPEARQTWRYDTSMPPELGWYLVGCYHNGEFDSHRSLNHTFAFGKHLVGGR